MQSPANSTTTPLAKQSIFIGSYERIVAFASVIITINSDTTNEISVYSSIDKKTTTKTVYNYTPGQATTFLISPITQPYIYFTVRNDSNDNQTLLNFSVIYSTHGFTD